MCDYSLHQSLTRLANEGEQLVIHRFPGGSLGLASPAELKVDQCQPRLPQPRAWTWGGITHWFKQMNKEAPAPAAVCIPPGARLRLSDIPASLQKELDVKEEETVVFDQLSADPYAYRDCVKFRNGRRAILQCLKPGQRVEVLSLVPLAEESPEQVRETAHVRS
jgi:hypothetical protein